MRHRNREAASCGIVVRPMAFPSRCQSATSPPQCEPVKNPGWSCAVPTSRGKRGSSPKPVPIRSVLIIGHSQKKLQPDPDNAQNPEGPPIRSTNSGASRP
jgi:hypothetical protein